MSRNNQESYFVRRTLWVFFALGVWLTFMRFTRQFGFVDALTVDVLRLIPVIFCCLLIIRLSWRSGISRAIFTTFVVLTISLCIDLSLSVTEEIRPWADVPVIGRDSTVRPGLERLASSIWFSAGFCLIFLMVRSMEQSSRKLQRALSDLRAAQEQNIRRERLSALGQMASGIAHDLNNTLAPVVAYTESLLADPNLTDEQRHRCQCALQAATDAAAVIKRLGHFYRGDAPASTKETICLKELVAQIPLLTRPKWRDEAQLQGRNYDVGLELRDVPTIQGDAAELRMVFTNLVFNAIDAMPAGGQITLKVVPRDDFVAVEVVDTGVGMTDEQAARCFEPFFSTKREKSGLGLSVCHGIVEQHGGMMEIEPNPQGGAIVRVLLPAAAECPTGSAQPPVSSFSLSSLRCLYIEDDFDVRDALATLFEVIGVPLDLAIDGADGLEQVQTHSYDVVFTDVGMNGTDGVSVLTEIKRGQPQLPVVVISGWPRDEVQAWFSGNTQPDHILEKPATLKEIQQVLAALPVSRHAEAIADA